MSVHTSNPSDSPVGWQSRFRDRLERGRDSSVELGLWVVAVLVMLLDVGLTSYGLSLGLSEVNPLGRMALAAFGPVGLLLTKLPVLCLASVGRWVLSDAERWVVPLGLVLPWGTAVVLNVSLIASTL